MCPVTASRTRLFVENRPISQHINTKITKSLLCLLCFTNFMEYIQYNASHYKKERHYLIYVVLINQRTLFSLNALNLVQQERLLQHLQKLLSKALANQESLIEVLST